jgi:uncharacterized phiE125 gp8 family phage protein
MILKCITPPTNEPVLLADVEGQCRTGDLSAEASTVERFITSVRQRAEAITRRAIITQTWRMTLTGFPDAIKIPMPPLQTIDSITYVDVDGVTQTLDPSLYRVNTDEEPSKVYPAYGETWPTTLDDINTVIITFTAGYATASPMSASGRWQVAVDDEGTVYAKDLQAEAAGGIIDTVPESIRQWILINVANLYENRESIVVGTGVSVDLSRSLADGLLDDFRVWGW